ncbi:recombinase family protein [Tepidibacter sp. Z1-5]|uniref:recombinase family protein n=1 Tax=Tepidibacter sp. Z1-5 TaxID=3134138 RepID=UPI0030BE8F3E
MKGSQNETKSSKAQDFDPYKYAAIYARTSIKAANYSIDAQIDDCSKKLLEENLLLYKKYTDKESGKKIRFYERKGFKELLSDLEAGMFKTLVLSKRDRLSRDFKDFMHLKHIFKKHNIKVIFAKELEVESSDKNYISKFLDNMLIAISTLEPNTIAQRTADGRKYSREQGNLPMSICAYGYERGEKKHEFTIIDSEAIIVKKVFGLFLKVGEKQKNNKDYTLENFNQDIKSLFPNKKNACTFAHNIIKRPTYVAKMPICGQTPLEELIEVVDKDKDEYRIKDELLMDCNNIDKIIDDFDLWKKAALKLFNLVLRHRTEKRKILLNNFVYCEKCKKKFVLKKDFVIKEDTYIPKLVYTCSENCTQVEENLFIKIIFSELIVDCDNEVFERLLTSKLLEVEKDISSKQNELASISKNLRKSTQSYIRNSSNDSKKEELKKEIHEFKENEKSLKKTINSFGNKKMVLNYILNNIGVYKQTLASRVNEDPKDLSEDHVKYFKSNYEPLNINVKFRA